MTTYLINLVVCQTHEAELARELAARRAEAEAAEAARIAEAVAATEVMN